MSPSLNEIITLDVGGTQFVTTRQTLVREPHSMLACMFDPQFTMQSTELRRGAYFLDLNPVPFKHVLDYLRYGKLVRDPEMNLEAVYCIADSLKLDRLKRIVKEELEAQARAGSTVNITRLTQFLFHGLYPKVSIV